MTLAALRPALQPARPLIGPEDFRPSPVGRIDPGVSDAQRAVLQAICLRPELRPLSRDVTFSIDPGLDAPFRVGLDDSLRFHPDSLIDPVAGAVLLRHGLELILYQRLAANLADHRRMAAPWLAARTAALYEQSLPAEGRARVELALPEWLLRSYRLLGNDELSSLQAEALVLAAGLGCLQDLDLAVARSLSATLQEQIWALVVNLAALAAPSEHLLATGGDPRLRLDPETGMNGYGSRPRPCPGVLSFASSTATSVSEEGFAAAERLRRSLIEHALFDELPAIFGAECLRLRRDIARMCGVEHGEEVDVILTASGTDAEFHAIYLAGGRSGRPLVNIVIGPDETGSGVPLAAAGRHFASATALGIPVEKGEPVAGLGAERIELATLAVRDQAGAPRSPDVLDRDLEQLVTAALGRGARVLIHLLDSAKTGLGAPSLAALRRMRSYAPDEIDIVVDACQMRLAREELAAYLDLGFMVMVTGSKFLTGPAFAGALLVPRSFAVRLPHLGLFPDGLRAYVARTDWPPDWPVHGPPLGEQVNLGPLLRWQAALWEQDALDAVDRTTQEWILQTLRGELHAALAASPWLEPVEAPPYDRSALGSAPAGQQTIFPFNLLRAGQPGATLTMAEARQVHQWLNRDLSAALPEGSEELSDEDRAALARPCHLGQPVKLARPGGIEAGALRLCLSARTISRTAFDPLRGPTFEARLDRARREIRLALRKTDLVARHFDRLSQTL